MKNTYIVRVNNLTDNLHCDWEYESLEKANAVAKNTGEALKVFAKVEWSIEIIKKGENHA